MKRLRRLYYWLRAFFVDKVKEPLMLKFVCKRWGHLYEDRRDWCSRCSGINAESLRSIIFYFLRDKKPAECSLSELKARAKERGAFYSDSELALRLVLLAQGDSALIELHIRLKQ